MISIVFTRTLVKKKGLIKPELPSLQTFKHSCIDHKKMRVSKNGFRLRMQSRSSKMQYRLPRNTEELNPFSMNQFLNNMAPALVVGVLVSIVSAVITVRLALKRFRQEHWWERKAEAYSRIMEAFHDLSKYYDSLEVEALGGKVLTDERWAVIRAEYEGSLKQINKATAIGSFIISQEAAAILEAFQKRSLPNPQETAPFDFYFDASKGCKEAALLLRKAAKGDLRV